MNIDKMVHQSFKNLDDIMSWGDNNRELLDSLKPGDTFMMNGKKWVKHENGYSWTIGEDY